MAKNTKNYIQFYTAGSTAVKVQIQDERTWAPLPVEKPKPKFIIPVDPVAIIGFAVAICMLVMMAVGMVRLNAERERTATMENYVQLLQQENVRLQAEFDAECNLEEIEKTALALGMIPAEEAQHTPITVEAPQVPEVETVTLWDRIGTFLSGLFA